MRSLLFLFLLPLIVVSTSSYSATRGSLFLIGFIPVHFDLRIDPVIGQLETLDITNGEAALKIADVVESSNHMNGYEIYIESVNAGKLIHNNGINQAPYQIKYGVAGALVNPPALGSPLLVKTSGALIGLTFDFEEVFITIAPVAGLPGGAYTDTLVFTMQGL